MRYGRVFMMLNLFFIVCSHYLSKCVTVLKLAKVYMFRDYKIMFSLLVSKIFSCDFVIKFASYRQLSAFLSLLSPRPVNCVKTDFLLDYAKQQLSRYFLFLSLTVQYIDYGLDRPWFEFRKGLEIYVTSEMSRLL